MKPVAPKLQKRFDRWLKNQDGKLSTKELKEIKKLERDALGFWRTVVKERAGKGCEALFCKKTKRINTHHIESYAMNKALRYEPKNGIRLCSTHHKFGRLSAHKSFCFLYQLMNESRPEDLTHLLENYQTKIKITKEFLIQTINELKRQL